MLGDMKAASLEGWMSLEEIQSGFRSARCQCTTNAAGAPLPQGERQRTIYSLYHARSGSDRRSVLASPLITQSRQLPTIPDYCQPLRNFHEISRAREGPALTGVGVEKVPRSPKLANFAG